MSAKSMRFLVASMCVLMGTLWVTILGGSAFAAGEWSNPNQSTSTAEELTERLNPVEKLALSTNGEVGVGSPRNELAPLALGSDRNLELVLERPAGRSKGAGSSSVGDTTVTVPGSVLALILAAIGMVAVARRKRP
jgi:hypothetical protein